MAEPITPPDMIGAGVASPQQPGPDAASLMSQLRQSPLPPQDASLLSAMPRQTPGQAYAQAAAGGVSAMTGRPNPVMQQQEMQQRQAMQYAQLQQRIMDQRMRREEGVLNLSKDLLQSDSEEARMVGARGIVGHLKANGMPVPDSLVKSMATRKADVGALMKDMELGLDDATIRLRHPGADDALIRDARANLTNDNARRVLGLKTSTDARKEAADLKIAEVSAIETDFPELKGTPPELKFLIDAEHRRINVGKGYREGTAESKQQAVTLAYEEYKADVRRKQALAEAESARKALKDERFEQLLQTMLVGGKPGGGGAGGPLDGGQQWEPSINVTPQGGSVGFNPPKPVSAETTSQINAVAEMSQSLGRIGAIKDSTKAKKTVEKYLGPYAQYRAAAETAVPGGMFQVPPEAVRLKADLANFKNYTLRLMSGAAVTASEEPRLMEEIPHMGLPPDQFWTLYERSRKKQEELKKRTVELALSGSQKSMSIAKELGLIDQAGRPTIVVGPARDAGATPSPLAPKVPPGAKMEGGELVSESGKYVWRGGKWIPR